MNLFNRPKGTKFISDPAVRFSATAFLLLLLASPMLQGAGQPAPEARPTFNAEQRGDLEKISAYLNGMHAVEGGFSQINPMYWREFSGEGGVVEENRDDSLLTF